jgi:hypothetical protein
MEQDNTHSPNLDQRTPGTLKTGSDDSSLDGPGQGAQTEEVEYNRVPPQRTVTVSVSYRVRGRGRPLPYALADEDGE